MLAFIQTGLGAIKNWRGLDAVQKWLRNEQREWGGESNKVKEYVAAIAAVTPADTAGASMGMGGFPLSREKGAYPDQLEFERAGLVVSAENERDVHRVRCLDNTIGRALKRIAAFNKAADRAGVERSKDSILTHATDLAAVLERVSARRPEDGVPARQLEYVFEQDGEKQLVTINVGRGHKNVAQAAPLKA